MNDQIHFLTIKNALDQFELKSQKEKNNVIDDLFESQPNIISLYKPLDNFLSDIENEIMIQLSCIIWMAFKQQRKSIKTVSMNVVKKHMSNNVWLKKLAEADDNIIGTALEGYPNRELLNFSYAMLTERYLSYIQSDNSANLMFYILKTLVDSLEAGSQ